VQVISSIKNPSIKKVMALNKKRGRVIHGQFLVEGIREIEMALESGLEPEEVLYNAHWAKEELDKFSSKLHKSKSFLVENDVFDKISYRDSVANAIGIFPLFDATIDNLNLKDGALILVLEAIEKPGNLGAIFRTADAAEVDAIIISNANTDFYNPNVIRASLGTVFTVPFAISSNDGTQAFLQTNQFKVYTTYLEGSVPHYDVDLKGNTAIVMGSEAFGVTTTWIDNATQTIKIPMNGKADSMNVSTAAAVVVFEAIRQRM
jgi:RNA methyltransferase, TrmH family